MTPDQLAALHARCFSVPAPWSVSDFEGLLADPTASLFERPEGFLLLRCVADEAEILTLAVDPDARRRGVASALIADAVRFVGEHRITRVFLEVSKENDSAIALYGKQGFGEVGRRRNYYLAPDGRRVDALILERRIDLSTGQNPA